MMIKNTTCFSRTVLSAGALLLVLSACSRQDGRPPQGPVEVGYLVMQPQHQSILTELPGRTTAYLSADIRPQIGGIILQRLFKEGATVKQGQALYQIDPASYQAAYESAKAALAKTQATLASATLKAQRYEELTKIDAVAKQDNDDMQSTLHQDQADVDVARAALKTAKINLDYTRISSPITGRIDKSTVTPGALVVAEQTTALTTVQKIDPIYVDVTQSSVDVLRLRKELANGKIKRSGDNATSVNIVLEDGSTYAQRGKLEFSSLTVDTGTGMITLRALVPNPDGVLLPGAYVRAVLEEGVDDQAILVPQKAVSRDAAGGASAMIINDAGKVEQRTLSVARSVGNNWWISAGLKAGDKVIVDGLQKVRPGDTPQAVEMSDALSKTSTTVAK